ncbi:sigma-70 family RNA polymerase sigma factor [Spirosoma sp. HMF3257]|uniref:RNA polymerase sigma-70 region 2 domain-containing protein n=1 Tax=Spirosoma telluris TaxID=2183553 RepID=A0A327NKQ4_9BACT|nr:sigma-70 family RNA polymerase sigma factor [Spirosoma telluris]RAI73108.1 hypothetical protein HMF3257_37565 [Spirosoma telluris]
MPVPTAYRVYSDNQLLQLVAQSDQQAYDELYERYFTQLFNYAYEKTSDRFLAQEVVQELFITIWQQRTRIEITGLAKSYIFTTAKHLIIDQYRREASRAHYTDTFMSRQPLFTNQTEEQVWANELERSYQEFLAQLPPSASRLSCSVVKAIPIVKSRSKWVLPKKRLNNTSPRRCG